MTTLTVKRALWETDYDTFTDTEREIWEKADPQTERIYDGISEYFVMYDKPISRPEPIPEIPRQSFLGALVRLIVWTVGVLALQFVLLLAFFALIFVLHFVGILG